MPLTVTQQKIVQEIQRLDQDGEPLNISAVKRRHPELMEAVYAVKPIFVKFAHDINASGQLTTAIFIIGLIRTLCWQYMRLNVLARGIMR